MTDLWEKLLASQSFEETLVANPTDGFVPMHIIYQMCQEVADSNVRDAVKYAQALWFANFIDQWAWNLVQMHGSADMEMIYVGGEDGWVVEPTSTIH